MNRTILLARPHPFVAPVMRPFLEEAGYAVSIADGKSDLSAGATGKASPTLPVAFAGLLEFEKARPALERVGEQCGVKITPLGVIPGSESNPGLGRPETFVYFSKNDLNDPKKRGLATRLLRRHFR
jgi:hypothetical protein